jgi:hypothetical protein
MVPTGPGRVVTLVLFLTAAGRGRNGQRSAGWPVELGQR